MGDNFPRWQTEDSPYRFDRGLMQINSVHGYDAAALADPDTNMAAARHIYDQQGWNAWTSYRWGTYRDHYQPLTPEPPVEASPPPEPPPALTLDDWYQALTDAIAR